MLALDPPRRRNPLPVLLAVILLGAGLYILALTLSPQITPRITGNNAEAISKKLEANQPGDAGDRVYISKIGVDVEYSDSGERALESGAWWRAPSSGNPKDGGNFVLAAHRFQIGWTPTQTAKQSPFYHIDKLAINDQIVVDYKNQRYVYEITKIYQAAPDDIEIEAPTDKPQLTLYSCTLNGSSDGREVVIANLVGEAEVN